MSDEFDSKSFQPLFERAEREGLWFYTSYQDLWFSPKELKQLQSVGRFRWGAVNWKLRNPQERLNQLENEKRRLEHEQNEFLAKMKNPKIKICTIHGVMQAEASDGEDGAAVGNRAAGKGVCGGDGMCNMDDAENSDGTCANCGLPIRA